MNWYDCIVDDVPAIIARLPMTLRAKHYTTSMIAEEVRDKESYEGLRFMVESGLITIINPHWRSLELPKKLNGILSSPDKSLLILALELKSKCRSIAIATDDYALQEAASKLGFGVIRVRYRGARGIR